MEEFNIAATPHTPMISFRQEENIIDIQGESYPENTAAFYQPFFEFLEHQLKNPSGKALLINIELIYFNSSSSKVLMDFFDLLDAAAEQGQKITVNWIYHAEDEDTMEYGAEFQEDIENFTFNLQPKTS